MSWTAGIETPAAFKRRWKRSALRLRLFIKQQKATMAKMRSNTIRQMQMINVHCITSSHRCSTVQMNFSLFGHVCSLNR
uniref:Uncharacterized protein n=1 Tax=Romanomermis culicivorax TaxID=13658 RepID=A0A915JDF1_ROMCU